jgi:hypothetical protein
MTSLLLMALLAACESSKPKKGAAGGLGGSGQGGTSGESGGAAGFANDAGGRPVFRILGPVPDHAVRYGENPTDFSRVTFILGLSTDTSVIVGTSEIGSRIDAGCTLSAPTWRPQPST